MADYSSERTFSFELIDQPKHVCFHCYHIYSLGKKSRLLRSGKARQKFLVRLPIHKLYYITIDDCLLAVFASYSTCSNSTIKINQRTTVAGIFCFAALTECVSNECQRYLQIKGSNACVAYGMKNNFVNDQGQVSSVISSSPNDLETNSYALFNFLANVLYYSLDCCKLQSIFLKLTSSCNLLCGMLNLAHHPFRLVDELYEVFNPLPPIYQPSLQDLVLPAWKTAKPRQWTLALKFNRTGSKNFIFGGPGYLVFDKDHKVWINNNVRQGTPGSSTFCTILESDGQPVKFSPLFGGGLLGAGFGIAANQRKDIISIGNFGWGSTDYNPQDGSISTIKSDGKILSPPNGFTTGFKRAQGIYYDYDDNLWIASWGSQAPLGDPLDTPTFDFPSAKSAVVVYIKGNPKKFDRYEFSNEFHGTFDVVADKEGNIYATNAGNVKEGVNSSIYHFRLIGGKIVMINNWISGQVEAFRQVAIGPKGNIFVAAVITSRVIKFDQNLNLLQTFQNNIDGPWGVTFDSGGTMFIANFLRDKPIVPHKEPLGSLKDPLWGPGTHDMSGLFGFTRIRKQDDSTAKFINLPSGGQQVILANGFPLYGSNSLPSFEPMMRLTGTNIDAVGNVWAVNNWKPSLINNFLGNPGGDGVIAFMGLASISN